MRRIRFALIVLLVLAAGTAVWFRWHRAMPSTGGRTTGDGSAAVQPVPVPVPVADLVLQIEGGGEARAAAGTPLVFTVTLTGTTPEPAFRVGRQGNPWPGNLRFETPDGQPLPFQLQQLGPAVTSRFTGDPDAAPTPQLDEAVVDASHVHQVDFGVGPDEAARIPAGVYSARAVLPLDRNSTGAGLLASNAVAITIEQADAVAASRGHLEAAARFYLRAARWDDAHRTALPLVQRDDADAEAYTLLGEALDGMGRYEEALAAYQEAFASLPEDIDESPDYLAARMDAVQRRLAASPGGQRAAR
jgi:hypothetical protein